MPGPAAPERIAFTHCAIGADGRPILQGETTVRFFAEGGATRLVVETRASGPAHIVGRMLDGMETGWSQSLDRLADAVDASR
jgi:uncharacterized protein YndB with AHSA1/START domain